jgi:hypothetical protein
MTRFTTKMRMNRQLNQPHAFAHPCAPSPGELTVGAGNCRQAPSRIVSAGSLWQSLLHSGASTRMLTAMAARQFPA